MSGVVRQSTTNMAKTAIDGTKNVVKRISDYINSDIDTQPVIRPVIDLDEVRRDANNLNNLLSMTPSVGVMSNLRYIDSAMNNQNGVNDDVVTAIKDLKKAFGNVSGDTYNINGISYDSDSSVADAVQTLVRAAVIERRR